MNNDVKTVTDVDWNKLFCQKSFWQLYFDPEFEYENEAGVFESYMRLDDGFTTFLDCTLKLSDSFRLVFSFSDTPYDVTLQLGKANKPLQEIGFDDQAHWHPDVFRIEEMHAILQCLYKQPQAELSVDFKYIPLLLRKFTPATKENNEQLLRQTAEFIHDTGLFSRQESEELALKRHYIQEDFTWWYDEERGWVKKGEDGYSFRYCDPEDTYKYEGEEFNFALLRDFMRTVHKCAGIEDALV